MTVEALYKVRHGLISTSRLLLIIACFLRATFLTREKAILVTNLAILRASPIGSICLKAGIFRLRQLSFELGTKEVLALHRKNLLGGDGLVEQFFPHVGVLSQH